MRKLLAFVLAVCLCLSMIACGAGNSNESDLPEANELPEPTAATTEPIATEPEETDPPETEPPVTEPAEVTLSEQVVYEDESFKLTVKGIDFSDNFSVNIKMLAENNSDVNVSFVGDYFSINGITLYCNFYIEVAPGKKANDVLEISREDLAAVGIDNIATITAQDIFIYDNDAYEKIADVRFDLRTSIADGYQQTINRNGQTVVEQDGITVKYRGIVEGWDGEEELEFFVENRSDSSLTIYADNVSVNGFMVYGNLVAYAYPSCVTYATLDFSSSDMEENSIDSIEEVSFTLYAYDDIAHKKVWTSDEITVGRSATSDNQNVNSQVLEVELETLKKTLSAYSNIEVTHNDSIVTIEYWMPGIAQAVSQAASGNEERLNLWNSLIESEKTQCLTATNYLESAGFAELTVAWNILSDLDTEKVLLSIVDGEVIYNAANE